MSDGFKPRSKTKNVIPNVHPVNSLILPDGNVLKVQKKRQRKILSCIPCHQRKMKCTRERPICFNCETLATKNPDKGNEIKSACKYFVNDIKKNLKIENVINSSSVPRGGNEQKHVNYSPGTTSVTTDVPINKCFLDSVLPESQSNPTVSLSTSGYQAGKSYNLIFPQPISEGDNKGAEIVENDNLLEKISPPQSNNLTYQHVNAQSEYAVQFSKQFGAFIENLPSKKRSDQLLEIFETNVYAILPIIDMNSFKTKYEEFWYCGLFLKDNIEKLYEYVVYYKDKYDTPHERVNDFLYWYNKTNGELNPSNLLEFYTLLFAIYYTSIVSLVYEYLPKSQDSVNDILTYKAEVNQYYNIFQYSNDKWLNHPKVMSLPILQMNILVQSVINLKAGGSLINISKILRICQFYQMNRDPFKFHGLNNKGLIQTRRIIWWQIFLLDNFVSFFLNLPPLIKLDNFDTNLLIESTTGYNDPTILYLNCQYRFFLILDNLNSSVNGLNSKLKLTELNILKNKINELFFICKNTINRLETQFNKTNTNQRDFDNYKYFMLSMNILSDKMLIILQKKIILNQISTDDDELLFGTNLDLKLNSLKYLYTDLKNNLLPALIHYIHSFLGLSTKNMMKFNWKIKNHIPIDELIVLMQIFATNLKNGASQQNDNEYKDINMKIFLIDQSILSFINTWHLKLSSVNKLISLVSKIWKIMILKYNLNTNYAKSLSADFVYPIPIINENANINEFEKNKNQTKVADSMVVSCNDIIPRGLKMSTDIPPEQLNAFFSLNSLPDLLDIPFYTEFTDKQQQIDDLIALIEDELDNSSSSSDNKKGNESNSEGWTNLGTEDSTNVSLDDFHFYKNLKIDVIRLFNLVC